MLEVSEWPPEPKDSGSAEGPEDHCQGIEFALAAEMMKCHTS
jgi:hypothetical protein